LYSSSRVLGRVPVVGLVPVVSSGSLGPDQIWRLGFLVYMSACLAYRPIRAAQLPQIRSSFVGLSCGGATVLMGILWPTVVARRQTVSPCSGLGAWWDEHLMLQMFVVVFPLVGRGGEKRKKSNLFLCKSGAWRCGGVGDVSCGGEISTGCLPPTTLAKGQPL
jgi:hypothetical protein